MKVESEFTIPKGYIVNISPSAAQRLPTLWEKPNDFDPSRFTAESKKEINPYAWTPFGGGMHQGNRST
jgi:cytochrome P450